MGLSGGLLSPLFLPPPTSHELLLLFLHPVASLYPYWPSGRVHSSKQDGEKVLQLG